MLECRVLHRFRENPQLAHVLSPHRRTIRHQLAVRRVLVETRAQVVTTVRGVLRACGHKLATGTTEGQQAQGMKEAAVKARRRQRSIDKALGVAAARGRRHALDGGRAELPLVELLDGERRAPGSSAGRQSQRYAAPSGRERPTPLQPTSSSGVVCKKSAPAGPSMSFMPSSALSPTVNSSGTLVPGRMVST
ncbi:uncharacterized protein SOCE26_001370 [Sorangium cellulosum]|uniref:Uncharacterized protein n=1 Tax=Sorangium cellulosum TaxID=56 RepID=A0A2L0EHK5_SORCE|nr:uncharacterized protein SOCE26_001370 [Sorangium cellulosum]